MNCIYFGNGAVEYCIVFILFYSASHGMSLSEALPTTAIDTVGVYMPKHYMPQASEGLAQGPYVVARGGIRTSVPSARDPKKTRLF